MSFNTEFGIILKLKETKRKIKKDKDFAELFVEHEHGGKFTTEDHCNIPSDILTLLYFIACKAGYEHHSQGGFNEDKLSEEIKKIALNIPEEIKKIEDIEFKIFMECLNKNGMVLHGEDEEINSGYLLDELTDSIIIKGDGVYDGWHYAVLISSNFIYNCASDNKVYEIKDVNFDIEKALKTLYSKDESQLNFKDWLNEKIKYWKKIRI